MAKPTVTFPSQALVGEALLPLGLCPAHGEPAMSSRKRTYFTPTPAWVVLLVLVNPIVAVVVMMAIRKRVAGPVPECPRCVRRRRRHYLAVAAAWSACIGSLVFAAVWGGGPVALVGLGVAAVALVLSFASHGVTGSFSKDRLWVTLKRVHPAFTQAVQAAIGSAAPPQPPIVTVTTPVG